MLVDANAYNIVFGVSVDLVDRRLIPLYHCDCSPSLRHVTSGNGVR